MHIVKSKPEPDDLVGLYDYCNALYYSGELDPISDIKWSSRLRRELGKTYIDAENPGGPLIGMRIFKSLSSNPEKLEQVMVHEMAHVRQFQLYLKYNDASYLDECPEEGSRFDSPMHGKYFYESADRINDEFDHLNVRAREDVFISEYMQKRSYLYLLVDIVGADGAKQSIFYYDGKNKDRRIADVRQSLIDIYGGVNLQAVRLYSTSSPVVCVFSRMRMDFSFRKNQVASYYSPESVGKIQEIESVLLDECRFKNIATPIYRSVNAEIYSLRKFRHLPFSEYLLLAIDKVPSLATFKRDNEIQSYAEMIDSGESEVVRLLHAEWKNIKLHEIERCQGFHALMSLLEKSSHAPGVIAHEAMAVWRDFGTRRITQRDFIGVLSANLASSSSITVFEEFKREFISYSSKKDRFFDVGFNASFFIDQDESTFIGVCCLEKLNQGLQVRSADIREYSALWKNPTVEHVMGSGHLMRDLDKIVNEIASNYLDGSNSMVSRSLDGIVSGWAVFVARGISPAQIKTGLAQAVREYMPSKESSRNVHWPQTKEVQKFPDYLSAMIDASISHCYGVSSSAFRIRKEPVKKIDQMELF
ncbi:hypothetical protein RYA05_05205 [Pseudomonas syringae pv. actinidiae]|nr:hypothetical protein [Pseudomonas syringae pv. actinidiae]